MNLATGAKEARLNVPEEGEVNHDAIIVIDNPPRVADSEEAVIPELRSQDQSSLSRVPERVREYTPPRLAPVDTAEAVIYESSLGLVKGSSPQAPHAQYLAALSTLTELAHSLEWGVTIARDGDLSQHLMGLISHSNTASLETRSAAVLLVGTAIQNNPEALAGLLVHPMWQKAGPATTVVVALEQAEQQIAGEGAATYQARLVFLLSQLCQDEGQLNEMVNARGLERLLPLFNAEHAVIEDGKDKLRGRIGNLVADNAARMAIFDSEKGLDQLQSWCTALATALNKYERASLSSTGMAQVADTAFASISEAWQELGRVLEEKGGGCEPSAGTNSELR